MQKDSLDQLGVFDVILANLNLHVIRAKLGEMRQHLSSRGVLVISGLLYGDLPEIVQLARSQGMEITGTNKREGWICLFLKCLEPLI
jgi:ribosomal protein L11 methyltransferase